MARKPEHLNSEASKRKFEEEYGKEHGDEVFGATVGKVAREQAAENPTKTKTEHVPGHFSFSSKGKRFRVRPHPATIHAEPHTRGHHGGPCGSACRRGETMHRHRHGRR